jgi:hypothetical protein
METSTETPEATFDIIESIRKHVEQLKPFVPKRGLVCIGDYAAKILLKTPVVNRDSGVKSVFIQKSSEETLKALQSVANSQDVLAVDAEVDTHFWVNVNSYLAQNAAYAQQLKTYADSLHEAIVFVSLWEGLGSALLPNFVSQFKSSNASSVALAVFPSKAQPSDAYFNTLASIGLCAANDSAAIVLLDRDFIEDYVGIDRNGSRMKGNTILNYLLEMMLTKETLTQELSELSRALNVKFYSAFCVTGASFRVYGSFQSMLDAASLNSFLPSDLTTASVLYLLVRAPLNLKDKLSRGKIEMATAKWSKRILNVKSIYVSEPIYVDDTSDRVDIFVFAGSFDMTELVGLLQKKASKIKNDAMKKGLIKEEEWAAVVKNLTAEQ